MNTATLRLPRIAYSADGPVSPDVAPRMLSVVPLLREHMLEQVAQQLQRHVLEGEGRIRWTRRNSSSPGSSVASGVISSLPNAAAVYVRSMIARRSAGAMSSM